MKQEKAIPEVGDVLCENGKFYKDSRVADNEGTHPVAMVVCVNNAKPVETGTDYYGLAIALEDLYNSELYPWVKSQEDMDKNCAGPDGIVDPNKPETFAEVLNGIAVTRRLANSECNKSHVHSAFVDVSKMDFPITDENEKDKFSGWFIPSIGQAFLAIKNVGYQWNDTKFVGGENLWAPLWNKALSLDFNNSFSTRMTCTTSTNEKPSFFLFWEEGLNEESMKNEIAVRPMLAFKKIE